MKNQHPQVETMFQPSLLKPLLEVIIYPLKMNESPLKREHFKGHIIFQPSNLWGYVSFQGGNAKQNIQPYWCLFFCKPDPPQKFPSLKGSKGKLFKGGACITSRGCWIKRWACFTHSPFCFARHWSVCLKPPILENVFLFSCQQWEIDWSSKHQPPI